MADVNDIINRLYALQSSAEKPKLKAIFDGTHLTVSDELGNLYGQFGARSGYKQYQNKEATNVPDKGPIPEGNWLLNYSDIEDFKMPYDEKPKFLNSWGRRRVKLKPLLSQRSRFCGLH